MAKVPHDAAMKILLAVAFAATSAFAVQPAVTPADAFTTIKKLAGEWRGPAAMKGMPPSHSIYRISADGSAVQETIFLGSNVNWGSVYEN